MFCLGFFFGHVRHFNAKPLAEFLLSSGNQVSTKPQSYLRRKQHTSHVAYFHLWFLTTGGKRLLHCIYDA